MCSFDSNSYTCEVYFSVIGQIVEMEIVRKIFLAENVTCIYRNISSLSTKGKILAIVCIALEVLSLFYSVFKVYHEIAIESNIDALFIISFTTLSRFNSILVIYLGLKNADEYKIFYKHTNAAYVQMITCENIQKSLKKVKIYGMIIISFFGVNEIVMITRFVLDFLPSILNRKPSAIEVIMFAHECCQILLSECRYFVQLVALIILINVVCLALKFMNLTLVTSTQMLENDNLQCEVLRKLKENINKFELVCYHISGCTTQLKKVYGIQIVYALFCASIHFIFLLYKGIHALISQEERNRFGSGNTLLLLCNYITVPVLTMHAGQKAQNEAGRVIRALARLHNNLLIIRGDGVAELKKAVINLHRQLAGNPVRIRMLFEVFLHMPMLPDIVNTVVSYTIILLQFNHVV